MAFVLSGLLIARRSAFVQVLSDFLPGSPSWSASLVGATSRARVFVIEPDSTVSTRVFSKVFAKRISFGLSIQFTGCLSPPVHA